MGVIELKGAGGSIVSVDTGLFINNEFVQASGDKTLDVENPTTESLLTSVSSAQSADVDRAVEAAEKSFHESWSKVQPAQRGELLRTLATLIERDADDLASLEAVEAGILFTESKGLSIPQACETLRYFAGWVDKITGQLLQTSVGYAYTRREPIGVCAAIVPWNAPLMITIWKLAPAIAAGNTLIIKTPEIAPLYGQKLAALVLEAGFPPGVINILCGEGTIAGQALAEHPRIRKIAFTGSAATGRQILKASAATNLKKVTLELGGKGPSIVFSDADFENAVFWTTTGITANNGQICAAGSRIYVHSSVYDRFLKAFGETILQASPGDPLCPKTTKGPMISKRQRDRIQGYIKHAQESQLAIVGEDQDYSSMRGYFQTNMAFRDVPKDSRMMKEEIFGPVASIAKFDTEEEAIELANDSEYGLSAAVFTNDISRADRVTAALESGQVTVNCWGALNANTPFGGVKQSGFGRDMGEEALDGWLVTKTVKHNILKKQE